MFFYNLLLTWVHNKLCTRRSLQNHSFFPFKTSIFTWHL